MLIVFTTTPNQKEAEELAQKIVSAKLAACVQILPSMKSIYYWNEAVQSDSENLVLIKTTAEKYEELEKFIERNHSYEVPEIVAVKAENVSSSYFNWVSESLLRENKKAD